MTRVFIGVGLNISPEANIRAAIRLLARRVRVVDLSTFYRTPAEGRPEQPDYINGVVAIETDLPPETLKNEVLRPIERRLGRRRKDDNSRPAPLISTSCYMARARCRRQTSAFQPRTSKSGALSPSRWRRLRQI